MLNTPLQESSVPGVLERVYGDGAVVTASGRSVPIFPVGLTERAGLALVELVAEHAAGAGGAGYQSVETGFGLGLSGLCIAAGVERGAERRGRGIEHQHTAIDPGQRDAGFLDSAGLVLFERAGLAGRLRLIEEPSELALPAMLGAGARFGGGFDLGFVDGAHWFENALIDIVMLCRLVRAGGLLIVDDQWMGGVRAATEYARLNLNVEPVACSLDGAERFGVLRVLEPDRGRGWDHWVPFECGEHRRGR